MQKKSETVQRVSRRVYLGLSLSCLEVSVCTEAEEDRYKYVKQSKLMLSVITAESVRSKCLMTYHSIIYNNYENQWKGLWTTRWL